MSSAVVRHAADRSSPQPTILSGLGVVLGKETVRSKVDLEDEQQVMGKRWTKGKQAGQGRDGNQSGCGFVTPGVELERSVGIIRSWPGLEGNGLPLGAVGSLRPGLSWEVASGVCMWGPWCVRINCQACEEAGKAWH